MGLNIKNENVHALVREAAERTGMSQTSVVEEALKRMLKELDAEQETRLEDLRAIVADIHAIMRESEYPPLTTDDLYDDEGLPA
ncbi:type II toxin-antitoxin system VapB family antitoxin [Nocardia iowensis]|uniref:Type II toxin-antitoxin system VapB family antitoxin n=1 Tax=Nocardia iowensis TaxID=204891 RepID=A0ABX8RMK7_NOCIO|nr:type II toxin-antitoxin system VapB family antitoxin [Nocardia iowensis]QXN90551.1 type II toxin-antitoxin system VapB family antitoxin [Nocardia iowensis]